MRYTQLLLLVFLNLVFSNLALHSQIVQDAISFHPIETGLSQSSISTIFEDTDGFLWLGTSNGIYRFDGTSMQVFEKSLEGNTGLSYGHVESIYQDDEKLLYIGTDQGLGIYDGKQHMVRPYPFKHDSLQIQSQNFKSVEKINNILWFGTNSNGLFRYDIETGETRTLSFNETKKGRNNYNEVLKIASLDNDRLLLITQGAIFIIENDLRVVKKIEAISSISSALRVGQNSFLVGSHTGELLQLEILGDNSGKTHKVSINPGYSILSLAQDDYGNIWVGSENDGLSIYSTSMGSVTNYKTNYSNPNSLQCNSIWSLFKAKNGVMWVGSFKKGLSFFDPDYYKFTHINNDPLHAQSLSNNNVNCFEEDEQGNLWIGTDGGGLNYWDRQKNTFEHYALGNGNLNSNVVLTLLHGDENKLWIGTWGNGLAILDKKSKKYTVWDTKNSFLASNNVIDLMQDTKGRIWIATLFGGLQYYDPVTNTHQNIVLQSDVDGTDAITVARLLQDSDGVIWAGTQTMGLFKLTEKENGWDVLHYHSLNENRNISHNYINTIIQDENNTVWVGTQAGLNRYLPGSGLFEAVTKAAGLINDAIKGIADTDDGFLWLSTENGIIRFDPINGEQLHYDTGDGLQGNEFNAASQYKTASTCELVFGGSNGFNIFTPEQATKRTDNPKVYLSGLKIFNKSVLPNDDFGILNRHISEVDSLTLSYDQAVVDFEFNALTYRHPEKVNYAYFLEGFEKAWNFVGNKTSATYTNLNPGKYTLRIKSTNSDGVWADNEYKLNISVTPPFWETWWFRLLAIALMVICFYIAYQLKVSNIKKNQIVLERQIDERTKELQQQRNKLVDAADELSSKNEEIQQFTYAVSHDLKSPLNNIKGIASLIPLDVPIQDFPELEKYLELIGISCNTMNELITDVTEIARLGKIENKNELLDTNEILNVAKDLISGKLCTEKVTLIIADALPKIYGDRNRMIQVFGNFFDNAIKYMGDQQHPTIRVEAQDNGDSVKFLVIDNGSGLDDNALTKLFTPFVRFHAKVKGTGLGLYMTKKIAASHDGTITAESAGKGKGATFILTLPKAEIAALKANNGLESVAKGLVDLV